ncbi:ATPase domain-containing protein [Sphingomonas glacialis]|uniref:non-specific serine/threonine protein kinase n=1 Tax=Sphingomonas glacialis TaxID=658225 RepID=A0A502G6N8_9SPHN|nr:ATPase domain-containing protein [Sphingomonas glacialis]TPG56533.1 recombinase RecA [Sphingomonas glacialis]
MTDMLPIPISKPDRVTSGIDGLDTILSGGFILGGMYIVQGTPGAGKTILTNQICFHHVGVGGRALFVTLLAENHARMIGNLRGLSFFDEAMIPDQMSYLSAFNEMRDGGLEALGKLLRREILRSRTTMLVIDGLVSAQASAKSDQAFKEFVHDLQEVALATDCTMFLTTNAGDKVSPEQTMVDGLLVLTDRMYGWQAESDLQVTKFRGGGFLRGRHSYQISDDGVTVYPRIEARYAHPSRGAELSTGRASMGIDRLDAMLGGGVPIASTTMVMGPSGAGKTTMGMHFLSGSSEAEPGLMFGFYETPTRLAVKADRLRPALRPLLDNGTVELLWQTPTSDLMDAYGERLLEAVHRRKVKRLFIDGLTAFQSAAIDPSRIGNFFSALANELRVLGVTTVYSLEVPDILGPAVRVPVDDASSLAENMILLRFVERRSRLYRLISILKVRDSDFDPSLYEYVLGDTGFQIRDTTNTVEDILSGSSDREAEVGDFSKHGG